MGVVDCLDHIRSDVVNLDILAGDGIADCPAVVSLGLLGVMRLDLAVAGLVPLLLGIYLGVPLLLILVQAFHELLNVWNSVGARIVAPGGCVFLLLHVA